MQKEEKEAIITNLIEIIGDNPHREGLQETPMRVIKMFDEIFRGYDQKQKPLMKWFENGKDGVQTKGLLIDGGYYFSYCEHHMIPFFGQYHFGYIPNKRIIGASKIGRTVDYFSAKLQIQERLCAEIADFLEEKIRPKGQILLMKGRHLCKEMRGVRKWNSPFETIEARGVFLENKNNCKDEFLSRISI